MIVSWSGGLGSVAYFACDQRVRSDQVGNLAGRVGSGHKNGPVEWTSLNYIAFLCKLEFQRTCE